MAQKQAMGRLIKLKQKIVMETEKKCQRCEMLKQAEFNLREAETEIIRARSAFNASHNDDAKAYSDKAHEFIRIAECLETQMQPDFKRIQFECPTSTLKKAINNLCEDLKQLDTEIERVFQNINSRKPKKIKTGDKVFTFNSNIEAATFLKANGVTVNGSGRFISFGDNCTFGKGTIIRGSGGIGDNCIFGENCDIGDMVKIGANCEVKDNQKIDAKSNIPANTVIPDSRFWR